jgi:curved DNA-binding protein CbpA
MNYYEILQVSNHAESEVIEAAYKRLSLKYHPDRNPACDAKEKMQQINEAYSILINSEKRKQYDAKMIRFDKRAIDVFGKTINIISTITKIPLKKINLSDLIGSDLNFDEESYRDFIEALQNEFFIDLNQENILNITNLTIRELIEFIKTILISDYKPAVQAQNTNKSKTSDDFWSSLFNIASEVITYANTSFGETCPHCGNKSWIGQDRKDKSIFDHIVGQRKIRCHSCGNIFLVDD